MSEQPITFAIVTCSDTRSMAEDAAGAALEQLIADNGWTCVSHVVVKDERQQIAEAIMKAADDPRTDVVDVYKRQRLWRLMISPLRFRPICAFSVRFR